MHHADMHRNFLADLKIDIGYAKSHDHDVVNLTGPIKARLSHLQPSLAIFEIEGRKLQDKRIFSRKVH